MELWVANFCYTFSAVLILEEMCGDNLEMLMSYNVNVYIYHFIYEKSKSFLSHPYFTQMDDDKREWLTCSLMRV